MMLDKLLMAIIRRPRNVLCIGLGIVCAVMTVARPASRSEVASAASSALLSADSSAAQTMAMREPAEVSEEALRTSMHQSYSESMDTSMYQSYSESMAASQLPPLLGSPDKCTAKGIDSISLIAGNHLHGHFRSCAMVGGEAEYLAEGGAHFIDSHDAVFRLEYMPSELYSNYTGSKTSAYVIEAFSEGWDKLVDHGVVAVSRDRLHPLTLCEFHSAGGVEACQFENVLLGSRDILAGQTWTEINPHWSPGWKPSASRFPIGYMSPKVLETLRYAETSVLGLEKTQQSSLAMQSLFLMAPMCDSISIFGLGTQIQTEVVDMWKEMQFLDMLSQGHDLQSSTCPQHEEDYASECEAMNQIICSLAAKGREGKLTVYKPSGPSLQDEIDPRHDISAFDAEAAHSAQEDQPHDRGVLIMGMHKNRAKRFAASAGLEGRLAGAKNLPQDWKETLALLRSKANAERKAARAQKKKHPEAAEDELSSDEEPTEGR